MGLSIIKDEPRFDFVGARKLAIILSALIILVGLASLVFKGGPRYGIDFAGGAAAQIKFAKSPPADQLAAQIEAAGAVGAALQRFGAEDQGEWLVRTADAETNAESMKKTLEAAFGKTAAETGFVIQRIETVGPKVGADLRGRAIEAIHYALLLIAIYISGRFEKRWGAAALMAGALSGAMYLLGVFGVPLSVMTAVAMILSLVLWWRLKLNYALGAVVALYHDIIITIGVFSLLNKEFDLNFVAALLTILGYSLNDTIIVFDRIRENLKSKTHATFTEVINASINQTLGRTILVSGLTFMVVFCLWLLGGAVIHDFAFALLIGIFVGTFSSIFIASPILLAFISEDDAARLVKDGGVLTKTA